MADISRSNNIISSLLKPLAKKYVRIKHPKVIAVAGSVGKTSTKLALAGILSREKKVSYMDDSYNSGLGLYLSVFRLKVPTTKLGWPLVLLRAIAKFFQPRPEILILEYGIDHPGDMEEMTGFIKPDISLLTAVTPEHMEYMKTIDAVGEEEAKVLSAATDLGVVNEADVDPKYLVNLETKLLGYGLPGSVGRYGINKWTRRGALVDFKLDSLVLKNVNVNFISEPLIRQLCGAALLAHHIGISEEAIRSVLEEVHPAASRMYPLDGRNGSVIIDDSTNFSPKAGVESIKALKNLPGGRHLAILGNMHELGDFETEGYSEVAKEFGGIDEIILVGELAEKYFVPLAEEQGFKKNNNLFHFDNAPSAGIFLRERLASDDIVLVKGPFGGFFLEEAVKKLLANADDSKHLTRQSDFWLRKKRELFGDLLDK